ncbi:VanW family protein [Amycolatopsis pigmentata]|uniref:VanW family protein n=1 Tax=Amycolatopsis pigmentata TaxID=450801 RepID=A0ABW5FSB2_9PSEU
MADEDSSPHGAPDRGPWDTWATAPVSRAGPTSDYFVPPDNALADEILDVGRPPRFDRSRAKLLLGRVMMVAGGLIAVAAVLYTIDLMANAGKVPRGVVVDGVDVGGLSRADAEAKLQRDLEPRLYRPIPVSAGDVRTTLDPAASGLSLDWRTTLARAGHQSLDPVVRIESFFTKHEVPVATDVDDDALDRAVSRLVADQLDHLPVEGDITFEPIPGTDGEVTPHAVEPRAGQAVSDAKGAVRLVKQHWLDDGGIHLDVGVTPVLATSEGVHETLDQVVAPAVARPVVAHGEGTDALLKPAAIAAAMRFAPRPGGALQMSLDAAKLQDVLRPQLATTEKPGKDAEIDFTGVVPAIRPSVDARKIDWTSTFNPLMAVLARPDGRDLTVRYQTARPGLTTEDAAGIGIREVVSEFTTGSLSGVMAANVAAAADKVSGVIIRPGQTFSLTGRIGPLTQATGFAPAAMNEDGSGPLVIGGGLSQFASTLYNAAYLAGLTDAGHTEHGYYVDRYPPGRDAEAFRDDGSVADLRFTDSLVSGMAIQAYVSGDTVTVRIWGTKRYHVESMTSGWQDVVLPPVQQDSGPSCRPSGGEPGFTVTDVRIRYDVVTGAEVGRDTRSVRYAPKPSVSCG